MSTLKEKLMLLGRPRVEMTIESPDKETELKVWFQRPTEAVEAVLRKKLNEEYEATLRGMKVAGDNDKSTWENTKEVFVEQGSEVAIQYILTHENQDIIAEANRLVGDEPDSEADDEAKDRFRESFKETYDDLYAKRKAKYQGQVEGKVLERATELMLTTQALIRAIDIYKRELVAVSIYERILDPSGTNTVTFEQVFTDSEEVAATCSSETIESIAQKVQDELQKVRDLPLTSVAKS